MINSAQTHMESMSSRLPGCMVIIKRKPAVDSSSSRDWPTIVDFEQESTQILIVLTFHICSMAIKSSFPELLIPFLTPFLDMCLYIL